MINIATLTDGTYETTSDLKNPLADGRVKHGVEAVKVFPAGTRFQVRFGGCEVLHEDSNIKLSVELFSVTVFDNVNTIKYHYITSGRSVAVKPDKVEITSSGHKLVDALLEVARPLKLETVGDVMDMRALADSGNTDAERLLAMLVQMGKVSVADVTMASMALDQVKESDDSWKEFDTTHEIRTTYRV